jgi:hypothetical protein
MTDSTYTSPIGIFYESKELDKNNFPIESSKIIVTGFDDVLQNRMIAHILCWLAHQDSPPKLAVIRNFKETFNLKRTLERFQLYDGGEVPLSTSVRRSDELAYFFRVASDVIGTESGKESFELNFQIAPGLEEYLKETFGDFYEKKKFLLTSKGGNLSISFD